MEDTLRIVVPLYKLSQLYNTLYPTDCTYRGGQQNQLNIYMFVPVKYLPDKIH